MKTTVYLGLGSNLANPIYQVKKALRALEALPLTDLKAHSGLYRSKPLGPQNQPDYINAVAVLNSELAPMIMLEKLQVIENQQGRVRNQRWGARTLDLDILLYGNRQSRNPRLILPHPGLFERAFVLYPLTDCAPNLILPDGQNVSDLKRRCSAEGLFEVNFDESYNFDPITQIQRKG